MKILIALFLIISLILAGCGDTPKNTIVKEELKPVATFEGIGGAITPSFTIKGTSGEPLDFEVDWDAKGSLFSFFLSFSSVDNPSIASNYNDALRGSMPVSFSPPNPFTSNADFAIEVIASMDCNWVIEIRQ